MVRQTYQRFRSNVQPTGCPALTGPLHKKKTTTSTILALILVLSKKKETTTPTILALIKPDPGRDGGAPVSTPSSPCSTLRCPRHPAPVRRAVFKTPRPTLERCRSSRSPSPRWLRCATLPHLWCPRPGGVPSREHRSPSRCTIGVFPALPLHKVITDSKNSNKPPLFLIPRLILLIFQCTKLLPAVCLIPLQAKKRILSCHIHAGPSAHLQHKSFLNKSCPTMFVDVKNEMKRHNAKITIISMYLLELILLMSFPYI